MMAVRKFFVYGMVVISVVLYSHVNGQTVTFHDPNPWLTLRTNSVAVKVLLDTLETKNSTIEFKLSKVENGKITSVGSKSIKSNEYSQEFEIAKLSDSLYGGKNYLRIDWNIQGKKDKKGTLQPLGLFLLPKDLPISVRSIQPKEIPTIDSEESGSPQQVGALGFSSAWDNHGLYFRFTLDKSIDSISILFDGKNGKNAFMAFSNRLITYKPAVDSFDALYFQRSCKDSSIVYEKHSWIQQISKQKKEKTLLIKIPWSDMGIIPAEGRMLGFLVTSFQGGQGHSLPAKADRFIPGTWGTLMLQR